MSLWNQKNGDEGEVRSWCTEQVSWGADNFCIRRLCGGRGGGGRRFCRQGNAGACRNKGRFSVSDKPGKGRVGRLVLVAWRSRGAERLCCCYASGPARLFWFCWVSQNLAALTLSLRFDLPQPPTSHRPALPNGSKKTKKTTTTQISTREDSDTPWHPLFTWIYQSENLSTETVRMEGFYIMCQKTENWYGAWLLAWS